MRSPNTPPRRKPKTSVSFGDFHSGWLGSARHRTDKITTRRCRSRHPAWFSTPRHHRAAKAGVLTHGQMDYVICITCAISCRGPRTRCLLVVAPLSHGAACMLAADRARRRHRADASERFDVAEAGLVERTASPTCSRADHSDDADPARLSRSPRSFQFALCHLCRRADVSRR